MKKFLTSILIFISGSIYFFSFANGTGNLISDKELENGFRSPSDTMQISTYWFWISDNITKDGIVKDLTAIKEAGITRVFTANVRLDEVPVGNVKFNTEEWWDMLHFTFKTATELGIDMGIFNSPGWSQTGGPWVKPEQSMRYLASTITHVKGGKKLDMILEKPEGDFEDVKVIAFPDKGSSGSILSVKNSKVSSFPDTDNAKNLIDGNQETKTVFAGQHEAVVIDFHADKPFTARSLKIFCDETPTSSPARFMVKENGTYIELASFLIDRYNPMPNVGFDPFAPVVITLPATKGKEFRLEISPVSPDMGIKEIEISSLPALERYPEKTLAKMHQTPFPYWDAYKWREQPELNEVKLALNESEIIDISEYLTGDRLNWKAPKGNWIIMRTGMKSTGVTNAQASPESIGLEVDKMSRKHVEAFFEDYVGQALKRIPAADRKSWKVIVMDSFETGGQNMTDGFLEEFQERYGYDPVPFIPVFQGFVVGNEEISDRFLWDIRRLIADKISFDYVGGLTEIANKNGITTWLENYGHWGYPGEFLQYGSMANELAGEFWAEGDLGNIENRAASSCAHIYGKNQVSAESFTSAGLPFLRYPAMVKPRGDKFFAEGINKSLVHLFIHQPYDDKTPGINAPFGTEFNRKNPWYIHFDLFTTYLKRVNFLLQQGKNVADVAYFISEDAPKMTGITDPELPLGYQFDYINADVIEKYLFVEDGLLTLPHGTQYRILVLPSDGKTMRPELLLKIEKLVNDGATVLGPPPFKSPSLENYPDADQKVKTVASELWKGIDGINVKSKKVGKGTIIYGADLNEAFDIIGCVPDCKLPEDSPVLYAHRDMGDRHVYYLTNQSDEKITLSAEFRVKGLKPEFWEPVTGYSRILPSFQQTGTGTIVPLKLEPNESAFIVFKEAGVSNSPLSAEINFPTPVNLENQFEPWLLSFKSQTAKDPQSITMNKLEDLSQNPDFDIKHFAGTVKYSSTFNLEDIPHGKILLDLGEVIATAKIKINGMDAGGVWTKPYYVDISEWVVKGKNTIAIEVATNLVNRLIGDQKIPENERTTWLTVNSYTAESELQKAGLLGPVILQVVN